MTTCTSIPAAAWMSRSITEPCTSSYHHERYATGVIATLDTRNGELSWINRGHPPPLLTIG